MPKDQVIDVVAEVTPVDDTAQIFKQLEELNSKLTDKDGGEWINVPHYGICWHPNSDRMGAPLGVPSPSTPPTAIEAIVKWGNTIDFDNIPQNAVVLIKLNVTDPMRVNMMQRAIAKQVLEPRIEKLKEKRTCILFMQAEDDISVMTEEEMGKAGWEKKEKSRIITL
jgi:hypothetical protein